MSNYLGDTEYQILKAGQEELTKYYGVIGSDHAYIHQAKGFVVPGISTSITSGGTYKLAFVTPTVASGKYIHWRPAMVSGLTTGVTAEVFKGSTGVSGGTAKTPVNMNHNSSAVSVMQSFVAGATVTTDGTLFQIIAGGTGGTGQSNAGGGGGADHERVLLPNTQYSVTITNQSGSTDTLSAFEFFWYEEDGYIA